MQGSCQHCIEGCCAVWLQFERTLIIAEDDSEVSYLEGCTAPSYDTNQVCQGHQYNNDLLFVRHSFYMTVL